MQNKKTDFGKGWYTLRPTNQPTYCQSKILQSRFTGISSVKKQTFSCYNHWARSRNFITAFMWSFEEYIALLTYLQTWSWIIKIKMIVYIKFLKWNKLQKHTWKSSIFDQQTRKHGWFCQNFDVYSHYFKTLSSKQYMCICSDKSNKMFA